MKLPKKAPAPFTSGYFPELDITPEMDAKEAASYQSLIGILQWIFELGRVDITVKTPHMDSCIAMPRHGHLEQLFHIFLLIRNKHNTEMVLDPSEPEMDQVCFDQEDWSNTVYGDFCEDIPPNEPK